MLTFKSSILVRLYYGRSGLERSHGIRPMRNVSDRTCGRNESFWFVCTIANSQLSAIINLKFFQAIARRNHQVQS